MKLLWRVSKKVYNWTWFPWMLFLTLFVCFLVGQASMHGRSKTLKGVRDIDTALIEKFTEACLVRGKEHADIERIQVALDTLIPEYKKGNRDEFTHEDLNRFYGGDDSRTTQGSR